MMMMMTMMMLCGHPLIMFRVNHSHEIKHMTVR